MTNPNKSSILSFAFAAGVSLLLLSGCATGRPPRQVGPPPRPVLPPEPEREREVDVGTLPPQEEIDLGVPLELLPEQETAPVRMDRPEPVPREGTPYTLRRGDTLSSVAAAHRMNWRQLADYNYIADPDKVRVGQVILIPPGRESEADRQPASVARPRTGTGTYEVQRGDSLSVIAQRHGTTVNELKELNNLRTDRLLVGQILKVPGEARQERTTPASPPSPRPEPETPAVPRATPTPEPEPAEAPELPALDLDLGQSPRADEARSDDPAPEPDPVISRAFPIVVQEGDTLQSIANNYIVPVEEIRTLNDLRPGQEVEAGQRLLIPPSSY